LYIDYFFYLIILIAVIKGFFRGLIKEVFKIAAVGCGAAAAFVFSKQAALYFAIKFDQPYFVWIVIAAVCIYLTVFLVISAVAYFIERIVESAELSGLNRIAGAAFGFCKVLIIVFFVFYFLNYIPTFTKLVAHSTIQKIYLKLRPAVKLPDIQKAKIVMDKLNELKNNQKLTVEAITPKKSNISNKSDTDISVIVDDLLKNTDVVENLTKNQLSELLKNDRFNELVERY